MSESAPVGEADSGNGGTDKEFSCPTCDRSFDTKGGMRYHHATIHDESIAKTQNECVYCGDSYEVRKYQADKSTYCSKDCKHKHQEETTAKENNPNWEGGKCIDECEYCGDEYEVIAARQDESRFCSTECSYEWQSENFTGENNHMWEGGKATMECEVCGEIFKVRQDKLEDRRFCSDDCRATRHSKYMSGENHPNWKENVTPEYGPNWSEQAERARERDGHECQVCGLDQDEHWRKLEVHHITPRSEFVNGKGEFDWERGNRLENLVTLCTSCHRKYEGWGVLPRS